MLCDQYLDIFSYTGSDLQINKSSIRISLAFCGLRSYWFIHVFCFFSTSVLEICNNLIMLLNIPFTMLVRTRAQQSLQSVKPYVYTTLDWGFHNSYPMEKLLTAFCQFLLLCNPSEFNRIGDVAKDMGPSHSQLSPGHKYSHHVAMAQGQWEERGGGSFSTGRVPQTPGWAGPSQGFSLQAWVNCSQVTQWVKNVAILVFGENY